MEHVIPRALQLPFLQLVSIYLQIFCILILSAMRVAGAVKKAGAALGGASAGVTLQAVGPALLQAVAALLLAVAEGPALLQAVAGLLLAVAEGPALLQAVAALLLAVAVGPALLQAVAGLNLTDSF
ncbi:hypothetical protein EMCRGX_G007902 [Ephydatia muelleri]